MSPINPSTCVRLQFSGSPKTYSAKQYSDKISPLSSNLCSILKSNGVHGKRNKVSLKKKKVHFATPIDDSSSEFKGFTKNYLNRLDEKRSKLETITKALTLKQKTAVWQTIRKKHGSIPIKIGNTRTLFCSKKMCSKPVVSEMGMKDETICTILQSEPLLRNNLKPMQMVMMQCKVCSRKAYFPKKPQNVANLNAFICNDCFLKSKSMMFKLLKPIDPNTPKKDDLSETNSADLGSDQFDDKPIIITSIRSLSTQNIQDCQDHHTTPNLEVIDLEPMDTSLELEEIDKMSAKDGNDVLNDSADRDVKNVKIVTRHGKMVPVWTSEGYFMFQVPSKFEDHTDEFKLIPGQKRGSAEDPILIDDI